MRPHRWIVLTAAAVLCAACTPDEPIEPARDGALVLEVGGAECGSLRKALVTAGVFVAPPHEPVVSPIDSTDESAPPADDVDATPAPSSEPPPEPPTADHIIVKLEKGQTLIHLAKKHLGDGNRFREILTYNGWTDRDARRLREGQPVKVPVAPGATPR